MVAIIKNKVVAVSLTGVIVLSLLGVSLVTTNPDRLGPFGVTMWFLALLVGLTAVFSGLVHLITLWVKGSAAYYASLKTAAVVSTYLVALLALNSLRQLNVQDIVLVSLLVVLAGFYVRKV